MFGTLTGMRDWIETQLKSQLQPMHLEVRDLTGAGDHFEALIVTPQFDGKNTIMRHRLVYQALGEAMKEKIHALTLTTLSPREWKKES